MQPLPNGEEEQKHNLITKAIDYLEMYFEELRGNETDRKWSDLEHEVMDTILDLRSHIGEEYWLKTITRY